MKRSVAGCAGMLKASMSGVEKQESVRANSNTARQRSRLEIKNTTINVQLLSTHYAALGNMHHIQATLHT